MTLGILGAGIFLAAIIPLGVGSAFPFSVFTIAALTVMYFKLNPKPRLEPGLPSAGKPLGA